MITCLVRKTVLRNPGKISSFDWLAGPFSSSVAPTNLPNFSSSVSLSLEQDILSWISFTMISFSSVTTSKLSNALEVAFYPFSGTRHSYINASTDIGEVVDWIKFVVANKGDLAVLHNRNKMVNAFTNTEWVSGSGDAVISRSITSCAGMTAYLVLLAQTRVGFLSGGRGKSFHQLPPQEQAAQREEAYARATVALTRAQQICFIMGPLDMRGLVGAATIIEYLKYGASFCGQDDQDDPVFLIRIKDEDLLEAPDDAAFLQSLRHSCARVSGVFPSLALVEAYITEEDSAPRVRRLHLIIVDLHRRRRMANRVLRLLADLHIDRCAGECLNTLPIPWKPNQEAYQLRYVFGYAMEGSDLPCYIVWPTRTAEQSFWCIDAWKGDWVRLDMWLYGSNGY